jgi:hypothetical protein
MTPDEAEQVRDLHKRLLNMEIHDRLSALMVSIVADDPRAKNAVANMISVAAIMAKHLRPEDRQSYCMAVIGKR